MDRRDFLKAAVAALPVAAVGRVTEAKTSVHTEVSLGKFQVTTEVLPSQELRVSTALTNGLRDRGALAPRFWATRWRSTDGPNGQHIYVDDATHSAYLVKVRGGQVLEVETAPNWRPHLTDDEWGQAAAVLARAQRLPRDRLYQPMPPFVYRNRLGNTRRLIAVGVQPGKPRGGSVQLVDLVESQVVAALPTDDVPRCDQLCGVPNLEGCRKVLPEYDDWLVRVSRGGTELWRLELSRPRASSGMNASGIEIRNVHYRGRLALSRGNTPILNVDYSDNQCGCGPAYRDWFGDEACYSAEGTDAGGGLRLAQVRPSTIVDRSSGDRDSGSYRGVTLYATEDSVVAVTETKAAWYRYVNEWRFSEHGELRPTVSFAATQNPCTCISHTHHAYMRFDVPRVGVPILIRDGQPRPLLREHSFRRPVEFQLIAPGATGRMTLTPGNADGTANHFGGSDIWVVKARDTEIDDLVGFTDAPMMAKAQIDRFVDGEAIYGTDVAIWYAVHFAHDHDCTAARHRSMRLGPTLSFGRGG
jgi:hypothetical protein